MLVGMASALKVTVRYPATENPLFLRGSGCGLSWDAGLPLTRVSDTAWELELSGCDSAIEVKALLNDSQWMRGANAVVSSSSSTVYPWFHATEGTFQTLPAVWSPQLNISRDVIVYLPPSYRENTLKAHANVLVMHDGNNLFDPETAFMGNSWLIQETLDPHIEYGVIEEVVVVGAYNTPDRMNEYTYSVDPGEGFGGKGDLYLDFLEQTLIPLVNSTLRVDLTSNVGLGIMGSSLGGLISCYAGWTRQTYSRVGCMSSSFWWNN